MSMWPFRRKTARKRSRQTLADPESFRGRLSAKSPPPRTRTAPDDAMDTDASVGRAKSKRQSARPNKLQRRERTYSFSPGRRDTIDRKNGSRNQRKAGSSRPKDIEAGLGDSEKEELGWRDDDDVPRVPTLHGKRDGEHLVPRRRSSKKRRRNDNDREAEIRAMSNFMPLRPATDHWTAGRPMERDVRRSKTGFRLSPKGATKNEYDRENRSSDISLPTATSLHSSLSSDSEHVSFKVSAFEALSPRPTLRYAVYPRYPSGGNGSGSGPGRVPSQRRRLSERGPIPEATLKAHKRVDDLADDLSASDLRELMERDKRRREAKRQRDQERLERRLAKRAEKQAIAEAKAIEDGGEGEPYQNLERGVIGRDAVGLGIDPASAVRTSSKHRSSKKSSKRSLVDGRLTPEATSGDETDRDAKPRPLETFHRTDSLPLETPMTPHEHDDQVRPLAELQASKIRSFRRSKKSRSKSPPTITEKSEDEAKAQRRSSSGGNKGTLSWSSIFRWSNKSKRSSTDQRGPSSFSNTSRDSMSVQNTQLPTPPVSFVAVRRLSSGVPRRTLSRFREDLPDFAMSSTEFAAQSVEADAIPPTIAEASPDPDSHPDGMHFTSASTAQAARYDTPTSDHRDMDAMRETPSTFSRRDEFDASPEPHSMSLASIDSEGSWLSGRIRRPHPLSRIPDSTPRAQYPHYGSSPDHSMDHEHDHEHDGGEEVSIIDDEYLSRVTSPTHEPSGYNRKSTGEARPSSDEDEDDDAQWGAVREQQPNVVEGHTADRIKSREGLLKHFNEGDEDAGNSPTSAKSGSIGEELAPMRRATSVNLGKGHVRNFSAGSARLLDLTPRASIDAKRRSYEPKS